ncbi:MAG TPA: efflux RND transporter periplasmic adaptor subunit [Steroidobacteraceae bacterium]|jgi:cobalt-zinc-cadmium efflux system membrane fusion protein|nr:efflux RND transporter periplasmic adaptor subunit [Steroidobacteraceae bacterium]
MSDASDDPSESHKAQESIDRRAWSRTRQWRAVGIAAAVLAAVLACVWLGGRLFESGPAPVAAPQSPPGSFRPSPQQSKTLTFETVESHAFVSAEVTEGKIGVNGDRATQVFSPYSGRVLRVIAGIGDTVKAGAPLATIEAAEFVQSQNDLKAALAQSKLARSSEARKHALYDAKGGSLQDWQSAEADLATAEAALDAARNRLRILGRSGVQVAAMERSGSIDPVATLVAPIGGVVVDRQVGPGQYLQAGGGTSVYTIADPSSVWLLANVRETDAGLVKVGQTAEVHVLAYPKRVFTARLTFVSALVDPNTHRLPVRAEIDNRDGALKPEMFASFRILTSDTAESPAVPQSAVIHEGEAAHVWMLTPDGLLKLTEVHCGRTLDGLVEVTEGLRVGDKVVTKGGLFIDQAAVPATS